MSQQNTIGRTATTVAQVDGKTVVTYHQTAVVSFDAKEIKLDTGGWFTATTKTRMNQAANQFGLGYSVYQKKGRFYVNHKGQAVPFNGNVVTLSR